MGDIGNAIGDVVSWVNGLSGGQGFFVGLAAYFAGQKIKKKVKG